MVMKNETIDTGARAEHCDKAVALGVLQSAAGFYIGTECAVCRVPYSRESGYYESRDKAETALSTNDYGRTI